MRDLLEIEFASNPRRSGIGRQPGELTPASVSAIANSRGLLRTIVQESFPDQYLSQHVGGGRGNRTGFSTPVGRVRRGETA